MQFDGARCSRHSEYIEESKIGYQIVSSFLLTMTGADPLLHVASIPFYSTFLDKISLC